jgi:hypothetical protein
MPAPWPVSAAELKEHHCAFGVDRIPGQNAVTDFKRRARWQQAWWRRQQDLPLGTHGGGKSSGRILNGSKIEEAAARATGANFLSDRVRTAVRDRLAQPEGHQTLDERRLWCDLLSSMPLCFNLFGELHADSERLTTAVEGLWPQHPGRTAQIKFEWSPGRADPLFLNNRSAFDAAILLDLGAGGRGVIGIETKYHEDIRRERPPDPVGRLPRYRQVTELAGVFRDGWEAAVVGTDLQQLWLDHLLVLSMLQHPERSWAWGRFVVVYPSANPSVRAAVERYQGLLRTRESFEARTIEELLDEHVLHHPSTEIAFRDRYCW